MRFSSLFGHKSALHFCAAWLLVLLPSLQTPVQAVSYDPNVLPKGREYFQLRDGLNNSKAKFEKEKTGRVAFLGGSITAAPGWRTPLMQYLEKRFPETKFEFIGAGIGSLGSVPHSFRLEQDVLSKGPVDLLFVEAAVNDASNHPELPKQILRGMEGVIRHARLANPNTDIVQMHFVMPPHMEDYNAGRVPEVIQQHEKVAVAYGNPSLDLALEVTDRINAGEFTWAQDFKGLHPSPFGNQLYANSISRMLEAAWKAPVQDVRPHSLPENPIDPKSYFRGRFGKLEDVKLIRGFQKMTPWKPAVPTKTHTLLSKDTPALVALEPGAELELAFDGTGIGLLIGAGPDAGMLEVTCDGGPSKKIETFTSWSTGLYLAWAVMLEDELAPGHHVLRVKTSAEHHPRSVGTGLYVFRILEN
jgi:lysophospholipase L1-like esterase